MKMTTKVCTLTATLTTFGSLVGGANAQSIASIAEPYRFGPILRGPTPGHHISQSSTNNSFDSSPQTGSASFTDAWIHHDSGLDSAINTVPFPGSTTWSIDFGDELLNTSIPGYYVEQSYFNFSDLLPNSEVTVSNLVFSDGSSGTLSDLSIVTTNGTAEFTDIGGGAFTVKALTNDPGQQLDFYVRTKGMSVDSKIIKSADFKFDVAGMNGDRVALSGTRILYPVPVPEPSSVLLSVLASSLFVLRRRR